MPFCGCALYVYEWAGRPYWRAYENPCKPAKRKKKRKPKGK